tara:strand:+ start:34 stop:555 length:522 start_codon:yes stop_codon:yes gene_type:complete
MRNLSAHEVQRMRRLRRKDPEEHTIAKLAEVFEVSDTTVYYWLGATHLPGTTQRNPPRIPMKALRAIKLRRQRVGKLARATAEVNNHIVPAFASSTSAIRAELQRQHGTVVSRATVYNDLVKLKRCRQRGTASHSRPSTRWSTTSTPAFAWSTGPAAPGPRDRPAQSFQPFSR